MTVEEKAYNYASKVVKNRLTASEVAAHYGRGYIDGQEDMKQLGWHPASKLPPVDKETGLSEEVIAIQDRFQAGERVIYTRIVGGGWKHDNIKWWCYPPKEG